MWQVPSAAHAQIVHVLPYVQPGDGWSLDGTDVKVIHWLTDKTPGNFVIEYQASGGPMRTAKPKRVSLDFDALPTKTEKGKDSKKESDKKAKTPKDSKGTQETKKAPKDSKESKEAKDDLVVPKEPKVPPPPEKSHHYFRYTAYLDALPFNSDIHYRVKLGNKIIREATFRSRATADKTVRCVLVGDMAQGRSYQKEVAFRISEQKPEFFVALGDIVYSQGRLNEYMHHFWNTYNDVTKAGPKTGAPLMATIPFYPVLGNHDVSAKLDKTPDALAAYYFFSPPKNGPGIGPWTTLITSQGEAAAKFHLAAADGYPFIDDYSFDYGPAHFTVINANRPLDNPVFIKWLKKDLTTTKAKWKFVCFHQPPFHSSKTHYADQQVRPLQPLFEECGVNVTFGGHVHNYQRTVPLKFAITENEVIKKNRPVDGYLTLDTVFDGIKNTHPAGVIHVVAGGGGASLVGPGLDKTSDYLWEKYGPRNYDDYTAKMVVDKHSFVVMDISPERLDIRAIADSGEEIDRFTITIGE